MRASTCASPTGKQQTIPLTTHHCKTLPPPHCSLNLTADQIQWADLLVPIGGDGTFLMAAGRASPVLAGHSRCTPVVGFNSDPVRSEGRLMLPKQFSHDPRAAVRKIIEVIYTRLKRIQPPWITRD